MSGFDSLFEFERKLSEFTGAPYVVAVDSCTHAIEACMYLTDVKQTKLTAYTYLSIPMLLKRLGISYRLISESWVGEYKFHNTNIWDSALTLNRNMYRPGQIQCLSFGFDKPLALEHGGAILLDDKELAQDLALYTRDGRDLTVSLWGEVDVYKLSQHHCMRLKTAELGLAKLENFDGNTTIKPYPDLRLIQIT